MIPRPRDARDGDGEGRDAGNDDSEIDARVEPAVGLCQMRSSVGESCRAPWSTLSTRTSSLHPHSAHGSP